MEIAIRSSDTVALLTGAGISAESGLKTFRDAGGLWEQYRIEDVATPEAFNNDPELVWSFYNQRRQQLALSAPNAAHYAITEFRHRFPNTYVITQNVDDLHERAGNVNVIHMHGSLSGIKCTKCSYRRIDLEPVNSVPLCPQCSSRLRPDIVWFSEMPYHMDSIMNIINICRLFISIGTSGTVYPAAHFIEIASGRGALTVLINKEYVHCSSEHFIEGSAAETLPVFLRSIGVNNG